MSPETKDKQKITPYLWFDDQAEEAANSYVAIFSSLTGSASDKKDRRSGKLAAIQARAQRFPANRRGRQ